MFRKEVVVWRGRMCGQWEGYRKEESLFINKRSPFCQLGIQEHWEKRTCFLRRQPAGSLQWVWLGHFCLVCVVAAHNGCKKLQIWYMHNLIHYSNGIVIISYMWIIYMGITVNVFTVCQPSRFRIIYYKQFNSGIDLCSAYTEGCNIYSMNWWN